MSNKQRLTSILVVDTETTGLDGYPNDYVVEIAICKVPLESLEVETVYNSVVGHDTSKWEHWQRNAWVFGNSNLTLEMVQKAKPEKEIVKEVQEILNNKFMTSFNSLFDFYSFLLHEPWNIQLPSEGLMPCIMLQAAPSCRLPGYYGDYKWPSLIEAYSLLCKNNPARVEHQRHRALDDTIMSSHVLLALLKEGAHSCQLLDETLLEQIRVF